MTTKHSTHKKDGQPHNTRVRTLPAILLAAALVLALCLGLAACGTGASSSVPGSAPPSQPAVSAPAPPLEEEPASEEPGFATRRKTRAAEMPMGEKDTWTIFIYTCGSDLESQGSLASLNLAQVLQAVPGDHINVVAQTGGAEAWGQPIDPMLAEAFGIEGDFATAAVNPGALQRYVLTDEFTLVDEQPLASMGNQETLYEFLSWGVENYPAEKMGLIFWNHGGGSLSGVCFDELYGHDALMPFEMANAFDKLYDEMTDRFEFIGFDACLMSTIEVANLLVPHARHMVASEETEPGFGWDYSALIDTLNTSPGVTGAELGQALCDAYFGYLRMIGIERSITLSVTDLEKVDAVLLALDALALQLEQGLQNPAYFAQVSRDISRVENYAIDHMIDLGDMADKLMDIAPDEAAALREALNEAVSYTVSGGARSYASGLSVYYPTAVSPGTIVQYGLCAPTPAYFNYINQLQYEKIRATLSRQQLVEIVREPALEASGHYTMQIDPASMYHVQNVAFQLFLAPEGNASAYLLGYDNDLIADFETGEVQDNFEAKWAHLDGQPLMLALEDFNLDYNLYSAPVMHNGERTDLMLQWVWNESEAEGGHYEILGTYSGEDPETGMASRQTLPLSPGDTVVPLYGTVPYDLVVSEEVVEDSEFLDENGKLVMSPGSTIQITAESQVLHQQLKAGQYLYQFFVIDVFDGEQTFAPVTFRVDDEDTAP